MPVLRVDPFPATFFLFFRPAHSFRRRLFLKNRAQGAAVRDACERTCGPARAGPRYQNFGRWRLKKAPVGEKVLRTASKGTRRRRRARSRGACAPTDRGRPTPTFGVDFRVIRRRLRKGLHRRWRSMYCTQFHFSIRCPTGVCMATPRVAARSPRLRLAARESGGEVGGS